MRKPISIKPMKLFVTAILALILSFPGQAQETPVWLVPYKQGKLWGLADTNGRVVIEPRFEWVDFAYSNRICFREKGFYGFLNEKGEVVIRPMFKNASSFNTAIEGIPIARVTNKKDSSYIIIRDGSVPVFPRRTSLVRQEPFYTTAEIIPKDINKRFAGIYDSVVLTKTAKDPWKDLGYYLVYKDGRVGLMDPAMNVKLAPDFQSLDVYGVRFIVARLENKYRIIDENNNYQYGDELDSVVYVPRTPYVHIKQNGKWGVLTNDLKPVLPAQYDMVITSINGKRHPFYTKTVYGIGYELDNVILLKKNGRTGLYNNQYHYMIEPKYKDILAATSYHPGTEDVPPRIFPVVYVVTDDGRQGFTDRTGTKRFFK